MKFNLQGLTLEEVLALLENNLSKLDFSNNFEGFESTVTLGHTSSDNIVTIRNNLTFVPTRYIILSQEGNGLITKTGTWNKNSLYLKNNGNEKVTLKVIFLK